MKSFNLLSQINDNPETSSKVKVKSIFDYNSKSNNKNNNNKSNNKNNNKNVLSSKNIKNINVLPKIRMKISEQEPGRYFYRDHALSRTGSNLNDKKNNFRSNNIIKTKENKESSLFNSLRKSSDNGPNRKVCLTLLNNIK